MLGMDLLSSAMQHASGAEALPPPPPPPPPPVADGFLGLWDLGAADTAAGVVVSVDGGRGLPLTALQGAATLSGGAAGFTGSQALGVLAPVAATFKQSRNLPAATGGAASGGFTCTGMDRIASGLHGGAWAFGNHGLDVEGSAAEQNSTVVIVSADFTTVLADLDVDVGGSSIQGVAFDPTDNGIWYAATQNGTIRKITQTGAEIAVIDVSPRQPNGLAYIPATGQLLMTEVDGGAYLYDAATGAAQGVLTLGFTEIDHIHFDTVSSILYATSGGNGSNANVQFVELDVSGAGVAVRTPRHAGSWSPQPGGLAGSQAPEGLYFDRAARTLHIANDGGFHTIATPARNLVASYDATPPGASGTRQLLIGGVTDIAATSSTRMVMGGDLAPSQAAWALYQRSGGGLQLNLGPDDNGMRLDMRWGNGIDGAHVWTLAVDLDARTATLTVDGVVRPGPNFSSGNMAGYLGSVRISSVLLGAGYEGAYTRYMIGQVSRIALGTSLDDLPALGAWLTPAA